MGKMKYHQGVYYQVVRENLTFEEAIEAFKKGEIIRYKDSEPLDPSVIEKIEYVGFTIEQIHSNDWFVVEVDGNMEDLKWEVSEMVREMGVEIDTRFYNEEKMTISTYWQIINDKFFFDDKSIYEMLKWFYDNKKDKFKNKK